MEEQNKVSRWHAPLPWGYSMRRADKGKWVLHSDHEAALKALKLELAGQNQHAQMILEAKNYWMDRALKAESQKGLI